MKKTILLGCMLLASTASFAQNLSFTNNNPVDGVLPIINATVYCTDGKFAMTGDIRPQESRGFSSAAFTSCPDRTPLQVYLGTTSNPKQNYCDTKVLEINGTYTLSYDVAGNGTINDPYKCKLRG